MLLTVLFHVYNKHIRANSQMRLQELNDDCLECIFKLLPTEEQFALMLVTPRFRNLIESMWKRQKKLKFAGTSEQRESLAQFAAVVSQHIVELNITDAAQLNLPAMRKYPKVRRGDFDASKIQFAEQFPALESLDLTWQDGHIARASRFRCRSTRCRSSTALALCENLTALVLDEDIALQLCRHIAETENCLRRLRKLSVRYYYDTLTVQVGYEETSAVIERMLDAIREMERYADRLHTVSYNFVWSQKFDILKANTIRNLRRLNILGYAAQDMCHEFVPRLQFRSPRYEDATFEVQIFRDFLAYAADCVRAQVSEDARQMPLHVHCYASHDLQKELNDILETSNLPEMMRLTWVRSPESYANYALPFHISMQMGS